MKRQEGTRQRTEVRRAQIADAARLVIIKHGSEHITIRGIAREIGITEGAIYRHFKSKRDILSHLVEDIEMNLVGDIDKGIASGGTPLQMIDSTLKSHITRIQQRRGVSFLIIAEIISLGDQKLDRQVTEALNKYMGRIADLVSEGIKSGEIRRDVSPETTAVLLFSTLHGLVNMWALSHHSFNLEERYLPLWELLRETIASKEQVRGPEAAPLLRRAG